MTVNKILIVLNIAALLVSLIWLYNEQELEALIASITAFATLVALSYAGKSSDSDNLTMKQKGGKGSTNYQSKGNININIKNEKQ